MTEKTEQKSTHQALVDEAHELWDQHKNWSKDDLLMNLDPVRRDAVVLGTLNYQVENGGFSQWLGNGYATDTGKLFVAFALDNVGTELAQKVRALAEKTVQFDREYVTGDDTHELDLEYYKVNDAFMKECEEHFARAVVQNVHAA